MAQFSLANLRFILDTEDDADSPGSEELIQQLRENIEVLFMLLLDTGQSGSATQDPPNDTTGVLTDSGASYDADEHNGRTLLITSGIAKNKTFTIDDTTATTLVCTGDNLYAVGVRSGDTYKILYDLKVNIDGHTHDGVNSAVLDPISQARLKTTTHIQSTGSTNWTKKTLTYADYGFECMFRTSNASYEVELARADQTNKGSRASTSYGGEQVWLRISNVAATAYLQYRYVTSSGEVFWIWLLRDKITKKILDADLSSDHCSFGLPDPSMREHPFLNYDPAKHEIVLITPGKDDLKLFYERKGTRDLLETVLQDFEVDDASEAEWPKQPVTVRLLSDDWFERWVTQTPVEIEKKVIPKVPYVLCKSLKLKPGQGA